jgi:histidine triad (HIT) family protein
MSANCVFCRIAKGELPASEVYRDHLCMAFLDIHPINEGHVLVVPLAHSPSLTDLSDEVAGHLFKIGKKLLAAIQASGLRCEGANLFLSDGAVAGQEVLHCHLHIAPRFEGDGQRVGFRHADSIDYPRERLNAIAGKIRGRLP